MMGEQPYSPRLRMWKPSTSANKVIGTLLYGRKPKGAVVRAENFTRPLAGISIQWEGVGCFVCPCEHTATDWILDKGTQDDLQHLAFLVGGMRAKYEWISEEQSREEFAAAMRGDD